MNLFSQERWGRCWQKTGVSFDSGKWFSRLAALYSEPHRYYHNAKHIADCLGQFDAVVQNIEDAFLVECAIWFHDAIYNSRATDNEERSADLARQCLSEAAAPNYIDRVTTLILATKAHLPTTPDAAVMLDIDLSILGRDEKTFSQYERQIREEYAWVPEEVFCSKRAEILENFIRRPRIYQTDYFFSQYEEMARFNLNRSISRLRS